MAQYQIFRSIRMILMGAFVISLPVATTYGSSDSRWADIVRYATPILLVLALLTGLVERTVRQRHNLPPHRLWGR